jgi:ATP-dependent Clp protease ATP-binding subunit ClpA
MWKFLVKFSDLIKEGIKEARQPPVRPSISTFTPRACQVLALARKEADRLNHNFLGTEHLLLGLIKLGQGAAVNVLQKMGLDLETVRREVEKQAPMGTGPKMHGTPYTPRVKKVIALAQKEAKNLNHTYVGTEHLLLGLLREGDGMAAKVLRALGMNLDKTRQEILKELDPNFVPLSGPESSPPVFHPPESLKSLEAIPGQMSVFTSNAQQILALGRMEAKRLNHNFLGTDHLLLGLIKLNGGAAVNVLQKMNVDLEALRKEIEKEIPMGPQPTPFTHVPYTPRVKKVVALAVKEANQLGYDYIGSEHLLLGLLREGDGVAGIVLRKAGVGIEQARQVILAERDTNRKVRPTEMQHAPVPQRVETTSIPQLDPKFRSKINSDFTPRALQVIALARKEADRMGHRHLGTEHLLLGLIKLGQGIAINVLLARGVDLTTACAEVEKLSQLGSPEKAPGNIPYTPRMKRVLASAREEADKLQHTYVGTEHLLLGLLREKEGVHAGVLRALGVEPDEIRRDVLRELDPNFGATG